MFKYSRKNNSARALMLLRTEKMKNKTSLWILTFFIILFSVAAKSTIGSQSSTNGLEISYPKIEYIPYGTTFDFHVHVHNYSNALVLTNETTQCGIHLYNSNGKLILKAYNLDYSEFDFGIELNTTILNHTGTYSYIVYCNTSDQAGFVSNLIEVTNKGHNPDEGKTLPFVVAVVSMIFLIFYLAFSLDQEHFLLKILLTTIGLFSFVIIPNAIINGVQVALSSMLTMTTYIPRFFLGYLLVYVNYVLWIKSKLMQLGIIKIKKKK